MTIIKEAIEGTETISSMSIQIETLAQEITKATTEEEIKTAALPIEL